jgi:hypothetical protein
MNLKTWVPGLIAALAVFLSGCSKSEQSAPPKTAAGSAATDSGTKRAAEPAAARPATNAPAPSVAKGSTGTGEPVLLRMKWPLGSRYVYRMDLEQRTTNRVPMMPKPVEQNVSMAMTYALSVTKELPDNGHELEMEFLANEMEIKMGDQVMMSYDSKESGKAAQNAMMAPFQKMIGSKIRMEVNAEGKTEKVDMQQWFNTISKGGDPMSNLLGQQFNEGFIRQIVDFGRAFPSQPVRMGESWPFKVEMPPSPAGKITVDAKITFKSWEDREQHKCAVLDTTGTFAGSPGQDAGPLGKLTVENGTIAGTSYFDPELGTLIDSAADQTMSLKGEVQMGPPPQNKDQPPATSFTINLGQHITTKLVEVGKVKP